MRAGSVAGRHAGDRDAADGRDSHQSFRRPHPRVAQTPPTPGDEKAGRAPRRQGAERRQIEVIVVRVEMSTASMAGSASMGMGGGTNRRGPNHDTGLAVADQMGSVSSVV